MPVLGREPGTQVFRELDEHPGDEQFPGVVVLRLDGGLFFATSDALEDRVREVALSTPGITAIVLDCVAIDFIDSQGSAKMREILELTEQAGVTLRLARVKPAVAERARTRRRPRPSRRGRDLPQRRASGGSPPGHPCSASARRQEQPRPGRGRPLTRARVEASESPASQAHRGPTVARR